ncbi:MAG: hypothetical protein RR142_06755 [Clostridia bacterium]
MDHQDERKQFQHAFDTTLSGMKSDPWLAQRILHNAKGEPKVKRKVSMGLILIIVLLLVSVAALAVTLVQRSEESNTMLIANQALFEKYGLTNQTIGLFAKNAKKDGEIWTVNYIANGYAPVLLGQYLVTVHGGKAAEITWSYDGSKEDLEKGDLTSPIWGQKQLEMALENPEEASAISGPLYEIDSALPLPDDQRQEGDAWWLGEMVHPAAPGTEDIKQEKAMSIALQAITQEYSLTKDELESAQLSQVKEGKAAGEAIFYQRDAGNPIWTFGFQLVQDGVDMDIAVVVDARTGEVLKTNLLTGGNG